LTVELAIFARFHAHEGTAAEAEAVLREQTAAVRKEPGCLAIQAYRSTRDPRLFFIHARWTNEEAFEIHAGLARTQEFVKRMETLIDHSFAAERARPLA
jgi:quinol monooxygenase YgiN